MAAGTRVAPAFTARSSQCGIGSASEIPTCRDAAGQSPIQSWYRGLDETARARVVRATDSLALGNVSATKPVGRGIHEFPIDFGPGYRVCFANDGREIVLLLTGGDKRRQQRDIDAAIAYWQDHRRRQDGA